jgi:hypothetical protein
MHRMHGVGRAVPQTHMISVMHSALVNTVHQRQRSNSVAELELDEWSDLCMRCKRTVG